jgi:hypothetical protein
MDDINRDGSARSRQLLAAHGTRRPAAHHRYVSHSCIFLASRKSIGVRPSFGGFVVPWGWGNYQTKTTAKYTT